MGASPSISTNATASSPAGVYSIAVTGGEADNYHFTYQAAVLVVGAGGQSINFVSELNATYGDEPLHPEGNATSGLSVTYASSNPDVVEVNGSELIIRGAGDAIVTASQGGNANFDPASDRNATVHVETAALAVIAHDASKA